MGNDQSLSINNEFKKRHGRELKRLKEVSNPCLFRHKTGLSLILYVYADNTVEIGAFGLEDTANGWWKCGIQFENEDDVMRLIRALETDTAEEEKRYGVKESVVEVNPDTKYVEIKYEFRESADAETPATTTTDSSSVSGETRKHQRCEVWHQRVVPIPPVGPDVEGCDPKDYYRITECAISTERERKHREEAQARLRRVSATRSRGAGQLLEKLFKEQRDE